MQTAIVVLLLVVLALLIALLRRRPAVDAGPINARFDTVEKLQERGERSVQDALAGLRNATSDQARDLRAEVQTTLKQSTDSLVQGVDRISAAQQQRLEDFAKQLAGLKAANEAGSSQLRLEVTNAIAQFKDVLDRRLNENANQLQLQFDAFSRKLSEFGQAAGDNAAKVRQELAASFKDLRESLQKQTTDASTLQKQQFDSFAAQLAGLTEKIERKFDELRTGVEAKVAQLQADNAAKLEEMRKTVDEKLQGTLEKRLGDSFKLVSDRLEQVHKGLGEMQSLATGVGDLKRVLSNVKTRGTWGEMQLGNLLEQVLTPDQYARNVQTKPGPGRESVEFALKLPGRDEESNSQVWLPIDAKFPKEDYERLVDAADKGDTAGVDLAGKELENRVRSQARDIREKYLAPPHTTDFALLYLPIEGLYAEVLRRPGLIDTLQRDHRVVVVGPTTLAALLNSLQMGFRTLAIQKRSSEVWKVLGAVKTEFGKFGDVLEKVKKKLDETGNTIEDAANRSRQLERKLRKVEALPSAESAQVLGESLAAAPGAIDPEDN